MSNPFIEYKKPSQDEMARSDVRLFNRSFFDQKDPSESAGAYIRVFSLYNTYTIDRQDLPRICQELYNHVLQKLQSGGVGQVHPYAVKFVDAAYQSKEEPRQYIVIERETNRKTKMTVFVRFLAFGDNLYVAVDSYVLGAIDTWRVAWRVVVTLIPLLFLLLQSIVSSLLIAFNPRGGGNILSTFICCLIPILLLSIFLWIGVIRGYVHHKDIILAIRQEFSRIPDFRSFNYDDMIMFFKSALPLVLFSIRDIFEKNGLSVKSLDDFIANINNINISTGGGSISMVSSAIGAGNTIRQRSQ